MPINRTPPVIFVMGPPGSGKSTQGSAVAQRFHFSEFDTGAAIRKSRGDSGPLADWFRASYATGKLTPPPLVAELVKRELQPLLEAGNGMVVRGSPRTLREAEEELDMLSAGARPRQAFLAILDVPKKEVVSRILERAKTSNRTDDTAAGIEQRWEEYRFRTEPAIQYMARRVPSVTVDGRRSIPEVTADIEQAVRQYIQLP